MLGIVLYQKKVRNLDYINRINRDFDHNMKHPALLIGLAAVFVASCSKTPIEEPIPSNSIVYTSSDNNIVTPYLASALDAKILSISYKDGKGTIAFDKEISTIGQNAFSNRMNLVSITIPDSVTGIGAAAFLKCPNLTSITIPESVTTIGEDAFFDCSSLVSVTIPNNVTTIGIAVFAYCSSLPGIIIPEGATIIDYRAFYNCSSLTSITIPASVTSIGGKAFFKCSGLASITILSKTPPSIFADAFTDTNDCPIYVPAGSIDAYKTAEGWGNYSERIQALSN